MESHLNSTETNTRNIAEFSDEQLKVVSEAYQSLQEQKALGERETPMADLRVALRDALGFKEVYELNNFELKQLAEQSSAELETRELTARINELQLIIKAADSAKNFGDLRVKLGEILDFMTVRNIGNNVELKEFISSCRQELLNLTEEPKTESLEEDKVGSEEHEDTTEAVKVKPEQVKPLYQKGDDVEFDGRKWRISNVSTSEGQVKYYLLTQSGDALERRWCLESDILKLIPKEKEIGIEETPTGNVDEVEKQITTPMSPEDMAKRGRELARRTETKVKPESIRKRVKAIKDAPLSLLVKAQNSAFFINTDSINIEDNESEQRSRRFKKWLVVGAVALGLAGVAIYLHSKGHNLIDNSPTDVWQPPDGRGIDIGGSVPVSPSFESYQPGVDNYPWDWASRNFGADKAMSTLHQLADQASAAGHSVEWHNLADGNQYNDWLTIDGKSGTKQVVDILSQYVE